MGKMRLGLAVAAVVLVPLVHKGLEAQQPARTDSRGQVTFAKDVAPILQNHCQECHRPGAIAPMSLLTYEDVRPWARSIKTKVSDRLMPPWYIDRRIGIRKFKEDPSLSDEQIATIVKWVDSGAPLGNPADLPKPREFADLNSWRIGQPDLIATMPEAFVVKAAAPDDWPTFTLDPKLTEDRYIKAVEVKPAPNSHVVVHHVTTTMTSGDEDRATAERAGGFLNEYALGKNGDIFDEGTGRLIKAGSKIRMNVHFHSNGETVPAKVSIGLKFYPKGVVPKHVVVTQHMGDNDDLDIPAGENNVRHDGYTILTKPAVITSFQPHLHNRGKGECMEVIVPPTMPDGTPITEGAPLARPITLSCIDRWEFNWHLVYNYADEVAPVVPAGTVVHVTTWHDNSATAKYNPNPRANVGYGQRTIDDMSFAWVSYYYLTDAEYKERVAARRAATTQNQNQ
jgi:hypothetical protein